MGEGLLFRELMISKPRGVVLKETIFLSVEVWPNRNNLVMGERISSTTISGSYLNSLTACSSFTSFFG